jgi:thioredoxin 1
MEPIILPAPPLAAKPLSSVADLTRALRASAKLIVVEFYAPWCGPSAEMASMLDAMFVKYQGVALFYKVDVELAPELAVHAGATSVPSLLLFKGGAEVRRSEGLPTPSSLQALLQAYI